MAGRPPPLAAIGQGAFRNTQPKRNENMEIDEEVWEVPLNIFNKPAIGNTKSLGANRAAMSLFNKPETPKKQLRIAANWHAPHAPNAANPEAGQAWKVHPNIFKTPKKTKIKTQRRSRRRKTRRQSRRLRK